MTKRQRKSRLGLFAWDWLQVETARAAQKQYDQELSDRIRERERLRREAVEEREVADGQA